MTGFNPFEGQNNPFLNGGIWRRNQSSSQATTDPQHSQPSNFFGGATQDLKSIQNLFANPESIFRDATQPPKTCVNPYLSQQQSAASFFGMRPAQNNQSQNPQNLFQRVFSPFIFFQ